MKLFMQILMQYFQLGIENHSSFLLCDMVILLQNFGKTVNAIKILLRLKEKHTSHTIFFRLCCSTKLK